MEEDDDEDSWSSVVEIGVFMALDGETDAEIFKAASNGSAWGWISEVGYRGPSVGPRTHTRGFARLLPERSLDCMVVTLAVFHSPIGWLKAVARSNTARVACCPGGTCE